MSKNRSIAVIIAVLAALMASCDGSDKEPQASSTPPATADCPTEKTALTGIEGALAPKLQAVFATLDDEGASKADKQNALTDLLFEIGQTADKTNTITSAELKEAATASSSALVRMRGALTELRTGVGTNDSSRIDTGRTDAEGAADDLKAAEGLAVKADCPA